MLHKQLLWILWIPKLPPRLVWEKFSPVSGGAPQSGQMNSLPQVLIIHVYTAVKWWPSLVPTSLTDWYMPADQNCTLLRGHLCSVWRSFYKSKDSYSIWFYFQICLTTFYSSRWPRDADWLGFTNRHWDNQSLGVAAFKCKLLAARPRQEISGQTIFRAFSWHKTTTAEKRWLYAPNFSSIFISLISCARFCSNQISMMWLKQSKYSLARNGEGGLTSME